MLIYLIGNIINYQISFGNQISISIFFGRSMLPNIGNRISIRQGKNHSKTKWTKKTGNKLKQMRKKKYKSRQDEKKRFWKSEEKMRTVLLLILLKANRNLDEMDEEAKKMAKRKKKPIKGNFPIIRILWGKDSTKKYTEF